MRTSPTRRVPPFLVLVAVALLAAGPLAAQEKEPSVLDLSSAEQYVKQFEFDVETAGGKPFQIGYSGQEAMRRVKALVEEFPDHPKVKELYERVRTCVRMSRGATFEITEEMLAYRKLEQLVAEELGKQAQAEWAAYEKELRESPRFLPEPLPAPEPGVGENEEKMFFRRVVLEGFEYPAHEFTTAGRQFCYVGNPTSGFYFLELSNRRWLGAYEALRRYRREANGRLPDRWTITGTVVGSEILVPRTGEKSASDVARFGWVVRPDAIYVSGLVFARVEPGHPKGGVYSGEESLAGLKAPYLTHTEVPEDVEPEQLVEIFAAAVKEKNYDLYLECIDPELRDSPLALERMRDLWRTSQRDFAEEIVHLEPIGVGEVRIIQGERLSDEDAETFFLSEEEKAEILARADDLIEEVNVTIRRFDERGKQVGTPRDIVLRRKKDDRWYVSNGIAL